MSPAISQRVPRIRFIPVSLVAALLLAAFTSLLGGCTLPKYPGESTRFLREIAAGQSGDATERPPAGPAAKAIAYTVQGRRQTADLYVPAAGPARAGIVLVAGLAELGNRDPRLVQFAQSMTRAHFAVLVPEIPNLRRLEIGPEDGRRVADAFRYLVSRPDLAPRGRAGIAAASYAVGPAVLAALEPDLRDRVRFIVGIAGHYDPEEVMIFAVTGYYRDQTERHPRWRRKDPDRYSKWAFLARNFDFSPRARDRGLLREIAERKLKHPDTPVGDLAAQLGPHGRDYFRLLTAQRPEEVRAMIVRLPPPARRQISAVNLATHDLSPLRATLILVHGRNDQLIPYTESKALAAAAPKAKLYLVENFTHVDLGELSLSDSLQFMRAVSAVLDFRN